MASVAALPDLRKQPRRVLHTLFPPLAKVGADGSTFQFFGFRSYACGAWLRYFRTVFRSRSRRRAISLTLNPS